MHSYNIPKPRNAVTNDAYWHIDYKLDTIGQMFCCLNMSLFAADILRARAGCRVVSHVLAAHLHPCTAATSVGLLLVK